MALLGKPIETDPELLKLLERAKGYVMTKGEREAQRRSWVIGEMMLEHPEMSREQAEAIYNRVMGE
jgi:hypothetical protein